MVWVCAKMVDPQFIDQPESSPFFGWKRGAKLHHVLIGREKGRITSVEQPTSRKRACTVGEPPDGTVGQPRFYSESMFSRF